MRSGEARKLNNMNKPPMLYVVGGNNPAKTADKVLYGNSGLFYIVVIIILFVCLGFLLNIGLRVQNINYQKGVFELNEMISIEEDRTDRLKVEISSLRAPSRILTAAENELEMQPSSSFEVIGLSGQDIDNSEKILNFISREAKPAMMGNYDNLLGTIYYVQDIVLVVSESVLTFFIP